MDKIRVVVSGTGLMGREVLAAVCGQEDMEAVGVIEKFSTDSVVSLPMPDARLIPLSSDPAALLEELKPDVVVDFTNAEWTKEVAPAAIARGARMVIGTTNLGEPFVEDLARLCEERQLGSLIAPNFALGAVVMIALARQASRFFDYAEIVENHQEKKLDSPSGTALAMARAMVEGHGGPFVHTMPEKEPLIGARGGDFEGVAIHSERMPGFVAHHEIAFGGLGQTLRIRHDSVGRDSFMPGILLAIREVTKRKGLVIGLDKLLGL
jgi:4-hydroxy-tetrahydrodipicolinate reductase